MRVILKKDSWLLGCPHSNCKLIKIKSSIGNTMLLQKATETPQSLLTLILCAWIQSTDQYHWSLFFWRFPCGGATELNGQHCWFAWEDGLISADLKKKKLNNLWLFIIESQKGCIFCWTLESLLLKLVLSDLQKATRISQAVVKCICLLK